MTNNKTPINQSINQQTKKGDKSFFCFLLSCGEAGLCALGDLFAHILTWRTTFRGIAGILVLVV